HLSPCVGLSQAIGNPEALRYYLSKGASPDCDSISNTGSPVLNTAAGSGDAEALRILVEHGANVNGLANTRWWRGYTPVDSAIFGGHFELVKFLEDHGGRAGHTVEQIRQDKLANLAWVDTTLLGQWSAQEVASARAENHYWVDNPSQVTAASVMAEEQE